MGEVKYRYVKWKIGRARKKFDVYSGGRSEGRGREQPLGSTGALIPDRLESR